MFLMTKQDQMDFLTKHNFQIERLDEQVISYKFAKVDRNSGVLTWNKENVLTKPRSMYRIYSIKADTPYESYYFFEHDLNMQLEKAVEYLQKQLEKKTRYAKQTA